MLLLGLLLLHITVAHTVAYEQCDRPSISGNCKASTSPLTKARLARQHGRKSGALAHSAHFTTSPTRALVTTKYSLVCAAYNSLALLVCFEQCGSCASWRNCLQLLLWRNVPQLTQYARVHTHASIYTCVHLSKCCQRRI